MSVDRDTVQRVARLARVGVADDRQQELANELSQILSWIEQLNEVKAVDSGPAATAVDAAIPKREDRVTESDGRSDILRNAPSSQDGFFIVPKVVD